MLMYTSNSLTSARSHPQNAEAVLVTSGVAADLIKITNVVFFSPVVAVSKTEVSAEML